MKAAIWTNGKKTVSGFWEYYPPSDIFIIKLNTRERISGLPIKFTTSNDTPEWGKWELKRGN